MLRKCATALAVSLVCLSGQAFAQQVSASATTSAVQRVGAQSDRSNDFIAGIPLTYAVFGLLTVAIVVAANDDNGASD